MVEHLLEQMEEYEIRRSSTSRGEGRGRRDVWKRDEIKKLLELVAERVEPGHAKSLPFEVVYDEFYKGSDEHKNKVFSDEKLLTSWVNTFIKNANKIAKDNNIPVRVGKRTKEGKFIFERLIETEEVNVSE